jgi:hypothetical protein
MISQINTQPKQNGVLPKQPKKKPAARAMVFHYERGEETIGSSSLQTRKKWLAVPEKTSSKIRSP